MGILDEVFKRFEQYAKDRTVRPEFQELAQKVLDEDCEAFKKKEESLKMTEKDHNRRYDI